MMHGVSMGWSMEHDPVNDLYDPKYTSKYTLFYSIRCCLNCERVKIISAEPELIARSFSFLVNENIVV